MTIWYALPSVIFAALAGAPAHAADNLPVKIEHLDRKSATCEITIQYPHTGMAAIDAQVAAWAAAQADYFANSARDKRPQDPPYSLDVSFAVTRNDSQMFETLFEYDTYTGGAHPNHQLYTLNFMLPGGARVYMAELIEPDGMAKVSELATANLIKELTEGTEPVTRDTDMIRRGTAVRPGGFETFTLNKSELILYFSDYEVAPYAAGPQMTRIPLAKIRGVMRDDWRAPQPSFDCEKAATPVEKAICSDVELARLDRRMAEGYHWKVQLAENDADKTRFRDEQRAFLARRDTGCAGQADAALTQCLTGQYQARIKEFDLQPH